MSRGLFDLGVRLRAATERRPVPIAHFAPVLPPVNPIAVVVDDDGEHVYITATDGTVTLAGTDRDGLAAIAALGGIMADTHRTLVIANVREMSALAALARQFRDEPASPVIGWWDQRSDHPGTGAVHLVVAAAALRWTLGVAPAREREVQTWCEWMGVTASGPHALLALADATASGHTLPDLLSAASADDHSWKRYRGRLNAGRSWWSPDSRSDAALGLASRSHAAEWFESIRLDDPRVAVAASFEGTVIAGTVLACDASEATVRADQMISRLRVDSKITAWKGEPDLIGGSLFTGRVEASSIDADGLTLTLGGFNRKVKELSAGDRITLRPARVDPFMQSNGRRLLASGYHRGGWIAGYGKPVVRGGNVPLDVMVAAADE